MKKIAGLLIIAAVLLCACSTSKWIRTPVEKHRDFIVTLEQHEVEGKIVLRQYAHPYKINITDLEKLMGDLTYAEQFGFMGKKEEQAVFQADEITRLAPTLAIALAQADDSQRIRFTSYNQGKAFIFSVSRETEGVMFIKPEGHLNIAFNLINSEIDPNEPASYPPGFSRINPLKIKSSDTTIIPTAPYEKLHEFDDAKPAPMWVIADLEKLQETMKNAPVIYIEKPVEVSPADVTPAPQAAPTATAVGPEPVAKKTEAQKTAPVPAPEDAIQKDIKNKLKYLKELMDEGLISEKDYNAKKSELLDKLD
jgi:hypothetical protein